MLVTFDGEAIHKAFHDPETGTLDLWSGFATGVGEAVAWGEGIVLVTDEDESFAHLSIDLEQVEVDAHPPQRPADAPAALEAGVEVAGDHPPGVLFDPVEGTLRVRFQPSEPHEWARIGTSLLWLGIDEDAHLVALVAEGVSRDARGSGQAAWLAEHGVGE